MGDTERNNTKRNSELLRKIICLVDPVIVVYNKDWFDTLPREIIDKMKIKRFINPDVVTDEEVLIFLHSVVMVMPVKTEYANIYAFLVGKITGEIFGSSNVPTDIIPENLSEYEKEELENLREFIKRARDTQEQKKLRKIKKVLGIGATRAKSVKKEGSHE